MEKFLSDLKQTVNGAVKKSGDLIELTKIKITIGETKNALRDKFTVLGEMTYLATKGEEMSDVDMEEIISEIDELKDVLADLDAKVAELGGKKICRHCNKVMEDDFAFCPACGSPMETSDDYED